MKNDAGRALGRLVGAEHADHALLAHAQELLGRVVRMCLIGAEGLLHEEALPAHGLVPQECVHGEVEEPRVLEGAAVPALEPSLGRAPDPGRDFKMLPKPMVF